MAKKVVLIDPPGWGMGLNIGLGYIAAVLSASGHRVQVIDLNNSRGRTRGRLRQAFKETPDYIGVSVSTSHNVKEAMGILSLCRNLMRDNQCTYVVGGIGATLAGGKLFEEYPRAFDILVRGEGEYTLAGIVSGEELAEVDGIIYRRGERVVENKDREPLANLDERPLPLYEAFDRLPSFALGMYDIMTSMGCPFNCAFCLNKLLSHRRFRARSPENVVGEIEHAAEAFGVRTFCIQDDNFVLNAERAGQICDLLVERRLGIELRLYGGVRADRLTPGLARRLRAAGCSFAMIGIENGDSETFPAVRKGETLDEIARAVSLLKANGIKAKGTAIIGLSGTTFASDMRSVEFVRNLGIESTWHHAFPYEGTELYEWVKEHGRFLHGELGDYGANAPHELDNLYPVTFETPEYGAEERERAFAIACISTGQYTRPLAGFNPFRASDLRRLLRILAMQHLHGAYPLRIVLSLVVELAKRLAYRAVLPSLSRRMQYRLLRLYSSLARATMRLCS